jgi:hypothetical protein
MKRKGINTASMTGGYHRQKDNPNVLGVTKIRMMKKHDYPSGRRD